MSLIKQYCILLAALLLAACNPESDVKTVDLEDKAVMLLMTYEASEFEPTWQLKLTDGNLIEFRQLDPDTGAGFVTETYSVTEQTSRTEGWTVLAVGAKGALTFTTTDVTVMGGCSHSGSGITHRDKVTVTSPLNTWRGCGGPEI